ncbi:MAG: class II aldolase/adducin family protein [Nitrospinae bacterium]|nr:class II aldolase/adducin family protein [Nitrospinota bacterium]
MFVNEREARKNIVDICKRIHERGWISSTDGNVSMKLGRDRILTTPSGIHKGFMTESDLVVTDMKGKLLSGSRKPSSELMMHITCYEQRPEINAVVHAHPTLCIAFSLAGVTLAKCLLPEVVFTLGSIPTAGYSTPTTNEVPKSIETLIQDYDGVILERHGSLTVGKTIFEAYNTLERMEHVAEITHKARQLGEVHPLNEEQMNKLMDVSKQLGLPQKKINTECNGCNVCPEGGMNLPTPQPLQPSVSSCSSGNQDAKLIELVTKEVLKELQKG